MRRTRTALTLALATITAALVGCTHYYRVNAPGSNTYYYTKNLKEHRGGEVTFTDGKTGDQVRLESFEKRSIDKEEYLRSIGR